MVLAIYAENYFNLGKQKNISDKTVLSILDSDLGPQDGRAIAAERYVVG